MSTEAQPSQIFGHVSTFIGKLRGRILRIIIPTGQWLAARVRAPGRPLVTLGTRYGGWVMAEPRPGVEARYALLCGAGEDVSFDLALQKSFDMNCIIVDPTPRAVAHWATLVERSAGGQPIAVNGSPTENYDVAGVDFEKMAYHPFAVWTKNENLKFWAPKNPSHVSFSAANIQNTSEYVLVPGKTLAELSPVPASEVELVKLDVEGVGTAIVGWMIDNEFLPRQILVELEECIFPTRERDQLVKQHVLRLEALGYDLVHFDGTANATFLRTERTGRADV